MGGRGASSGKEKSGAGGSASDKAAGASGTTQQIAAPTKLANGGLRSQNFQHGAYTFNAYWNGKEYSGGRRFVNITGVGNRRQYTIIMDKHGNVLQNNTGFSGEKAAAAALGWGK